MGLSDMFGSISNAWKANAPVALGGAEEIVNPAHATSADFIKAGVNPPMQVVPTQIMGMTPDQFSAAAGGLGAAITPKNSWQSKVGSLASMMGQQQLQALANQKKAKDMNATMGELFKAKPEFAKYFADQASPALPQVPGVANSANPNP